MLLLPGVAPVINRSAPTAKVKSSPANTLRLPVPVLTSALTAMLLPAFTACTNTLPLPLALRATPSVFPSVSVKLPAVLRSTMAPFPPLVRTSAWAKSFSVVTAAALPTRLTLTATLPTVRSSASSTKIPPPAARALSVPTAVSRWLSEAAMAVPAFKRRLAAEMSRSGSLVVPPVRGSASKMLPAVAVMLTEPVARVMSPTVTLVAANRRAAAVAPVLSKTLLAFMVMAPVPASRSMWPLPAAVLAVRTSASTAKLKARAARTLTFPLVLETSALTVMSVSTPKVCKSTFPVPWLLTATPSASVLPSVRLPAVVRSTMAPFPALVRKSDWLLTSVPLVPVLLRRLTVTDTLSTTKALVSSTNTPPLPAAPEKVVTVISSASVDVPTPPAAPACTRRPAAVTSTSASPSVMEPPAISAILPVLSRLPSAKLVPACTRMSPTALSVRPVKTMAVPACRSRVPVMTSRSVPTSAPSGRSRSALVPKVKAAPARKLTEPGADTSGTAAGVTVRSPSVVDKVCTETMPLVTVVSLALPSWALSRVSPPPAAVSTKRMLPLPVLLRLAVLTSVANRLMPVTASTSRAAPCKGSLLWPSPRLALVSLLCVTWPVAEYRVMFCKALAWLKSVDASKRLRMSMLPVASSLTAPLMAKPGLAALAMSSMVMVLPYTSSGA